MISSPPLVLCIEDSESDSELLRQAFSRLPSTRAPILLRVEHDGLAGLEAARQVQPHLILLDLVMPSPDGLEVLRALKEEGTTRSIPIVVLTNHAEDERVLRAYESHANAYVHKGRDFEELCRAVEAVTDFWLHTVMLPRGGRRELSR